MLATISAIFESSADKLPASLLKKTIPPVIASVIAMTTNPDSASTATSRARLSENHVLTVGASRCTSS